MSAKQATLITITVLLGFIMTSIYMGNNVKEGCESGYGICKANQHNI